MKKLIFSFMFMFMFFSSSSFALELPDKIQNWYSVSEYITPLIASANSQDLGRIVYKTYERRKSKGELQIIMTEGKGTGSLYVPSTVKNSKGVMPLDSGYKILNVSGKNAILETQPNLPLALAINYSDNVILTIESYSFNSQNNQTQDEEKLLKFAEELIELLI